MYTLQSFYYHKLCLQLVMYNIVEKKFNSLIELNKFISDTYSHGYTIERKYDDYIITSPLVEIHCVVYKE